MSLKEKLTNFFGLTDEEDYYEEAFEENAKNFGKLLKEIRLSADMTTSELAEKSKISQSYISQLENNVRLPSDKIIIKLAYGLVERNNDYADPEKLFFSNQTKAKAFEELVTTFTEVRNQMKIKNIPAIAELDSEHGSLMITSKEKEFLELLSKIPTSEYENLETYMKFLATK